MDRRKVLFLCTGNSARSQLAEALVNARRGDQWQAFSAGTQPAAQVNPYAIRALAEVGIPAEDARPKSITEWIGQRFDLIVTVCDDAAENCPVWPGAGKRIHIGFPDPAKVTGTDEIILAAFRDTRDAIERQIFPALDAFAVE
jgi:arsenate reductase